MHVYVLACVCLSREPFIKNKFFFSHCVKLLKYVSLQLSVNFLSITALTFHPFVLQITQVIIMALGVITTSSLMAPPLPKPSPQQSLPTSLAQRRGPLRVPCQLTTHRTAKGTRT